MRITSFIKGYRKEAVLAPLFKLLEALFELAVPLAVASLIDDGIAKGNSRHVFSMAFIMVVLGLIGLAASITAQYFSAKAAVGFSVKMKNALFQHVASLSESDRDRIGAPTIITRLTSDSMLVQNGINMFLRLFMRSPFVVFGAAIMAFTVDSQLASTFLWVIPLLSLIIFLVMRKTIPMYRDAQKALDKLLSRVRENLRGVRVLRAFSLEGEEKKSFSGEAESLRSIQISSGRISALLNPLTYAIVNIAIAIAATVAMTGITERMVLTLPRLVPSVTSVTQALNAASLAVEPTRVITQSKTTKSAITSVLLLAAASTSIVANSMIVRPQTM